MIPNKDLINQFFHLFYLSSWLNAELETSQCFKRLKRSINDDALLEIIVRVVSTYEEHLWRPGSPN